MPTTFVRIALAIGLGAIIASASAPQVAPRTADAGRSLAERLGTDDGISVVVTSSADGRGSLEMCGCGRQPLGGLARRVGYEKAVVEMTGGGAGLVRVDAGGAFDDTIDTGKNEVIPHIRNEWVLRGYLARDVAAINVALTDLRYLSQMNVTADRAARVERFPMLDRVVSANVVPAQPGTVRFRQFIVHETAAPRLGSRPVRTGVVGVYAAANEAGAMAFGYRIEDPVAALRKLLPEVRSQSDLIVLLVYGPSDRARAIAASVPGLDVVFYANNIFPDTEPASFENQLPIAPVVLQSRTLTEVRGKRSSAGGWQFAPRSVLLDEAIPSDPETLRMVYSARADIIR